MDPDSKDIPDLVSSADPADRLRALSLMRQRIDSGDSPTAHVPLARALILDPHNHCRWQAIIVVGECIEADPEVVWEVICEHGASADADMRTAVATVLLEHLLEHHFDTYFPKLKLRIEGGAALLADTLGRCWLFGAAIRHKDEVDALVSRCM